MATSRRDFLRKGTLLALVSGVPLSLVDKVVGRETLAGPTTKHGLSKAAFEAQLNTAFRINDEDTKVVVKLVEVADLPGGRAVGPDKEGFSLVFRGPLAGALKQSTYLIEHDRLGMFSFFIVPVMARERNTQHYEAVINRLYP